MSFFLCPRSSNRTRRGVEFRHSTTIFFKISFRLLTLLYAEVLFNRLNCAYLTKCNCIFILETNEISDICGKTVWKCLFRLLQFLKKYNYERALWRKGTEVCLTRQLWDNTQYLQYCVKWWIESRFPLPTSAVCGIQREADYYYIVESNERQITSIIFVFVHRLVHKVHLHTLWRTTKVCLVEMWTTGWEGIVLPQNLREFGGAGILLSFSYYKCESLWGWMFVPLFLRFTQKLLNWFR